MHIKTHLKTILRNDNRFYLDSLNLLICDDNKYFLKNLDSDERFRRGATGVLLQEQELRNLPPLSWKQSDKLLQNHPRRSSGLLPFLHSYGHCSELLEGGG